MTPRIYATLNTGSTIPVVGFGTWQPPPGKVDAAAVEHALRNGYRHLDCALVYGNEVEVGQGIKASGVSRQDIFITSKLWITFMGCVEESLDRSLKALGTDYLDLFLIHWPVALNPQGNDPMFPTLPDGRRDVIASWDLRVTLKQMEDVFASGRVKAIGVSNFSESTLDIIKTSWQVVPAVNQIELHPFNPHHQLKAYCEGMGIVLVLPSWKHRITSFGGPTN